MWQHMIQRFGFRTSFFDHIAHVLESYSLYELYEILFLSWVGLQVTIIFIIDQSEVCLNHQ